MHGCLLITNSYTGQASATQRSGAEKRRWGHEKRRWGHIHFLIPLRFGKLGTGPDPSTLSVSVRSQGRVTSDGGSLIVTARQADAIDSAHYFGGIGYFSNAGGTIGFAGRNDFGSGRVFYDAESVSEGFFPVLPFDVRHEDGVVQLDVVGQRIEFRAWRLGEPMPAEPMIVAIDDTYESGYVRIASGGADIGNATTFRFVQVATAPIPQPSTVVLSWFGLLSLLMCQRSSQFF